MKEEKHGHGKEREDMPEFMACYLCIIEISLCYYALGAGNELWLEHVWIRCRIWPHVKSIAPSPSPLKKPQIIRNQEDWE